MALGFATTDLEFLGYQEPADVTPKGVTGYSIFTALARAGLEKIEATFAYLKSDCSVDQLGDAASHTKSAQPLYVIYPKSLKLGKQTVQSRFGSRSKIYEHEELLWSHLKTLFGEYLSSVKQNVATEQYYIPPRKESASPDHRLDDELLAYLQGKGEIKPGDLAVVCAPAAVGKTTLSRQLLHKLVDGVELFRIIPTYVESSHWGRLQLESADDLWDIIQNSLSTFSSRIALRRDLFEYALRQGYICFIFDGFDELCGHKSAQFNPNEVLQDLAHIAERSDARIVLTTRTLYWNAEILTPPGNVRVLQLASFNTQQAKGYFKKFFHADPRAQQESIKLYSAVVDGSYRPATPGGARAQFVNLPVCVVMIAQYVLAQGTQLNVKQRPGRLLEEILEAICAREVARKKLITAPKEQLSAFEAVAIDDGSNSNPEFELDLVGAAGVQQVDVPKLIDHPLLTRTTSGNFKFAYEFLAPFFRATYLEQFLSSGTATVHGDVWRVMARESNGKGFILEHLVSLLPHDCLNTIKTAYRAVPIVQRDARSFLFHLARLVIEDDPFFKSSKEKTEALFDVVGFERNGDDTVVSDFNIQGPLEGLTFSHVTFRNGVFRDVSFNRSSANETTRFIRCTFSGEMIIPSDWSHARLVECTLLPPTNLAWESALESGAGDKDQNVKDAMKLALDKFWHHGRLRGSITVNDWGKGLLAHTRYAKPMIEAMFKVNLVKSIEISNVPKGGYAFDRGSIPDLQRFMDNRQLTGKLSSLYALLMAI